MRQAQFSVSDGNSSGLVERGWCVVGFASRMLVQCLQVYSATWVTILVRADDHAMAARNRFTDWDWFEQS